MPAELFPTRYRSTAYGISAAFGKVGVILSYLIFEWLYDVHSVENFRSRFFVASLVYSVSMVIGAASTTRLPETNNEPLEKIADDGEFVSSNARHHSSVNV